MIFAIALATAFAAPVAGQTRTDSVTLDATVGPGVGGGGRRNYFNEGSASAEITIGLRRRPGDATTPVYALTLGGQASIAFGDKCALELPPATGCRPKFPDIAHLGILGGLEQRGSAGSLRALVGPAFFGGGGGSGSTGGSGLGGQLQLDAADGFTHLAFMVAVRGSYVVRFSGERLYLGSLGFGLRVQ